MVLLAFLWLHPKDWPGWLTAVGTCVIAGFAIVALFSFRDARRTRHAELLSDLSRRWDEPLAADSREVAGEYDSRALVGLLTRIYEPPSWLSEDERRSDADTFVRLSASLNLSSATEKCASFRSRKVHHL